MIGKDANIMEELLKVKAAVTVVVTVHNSAKYLEECMDSVCVQSLDNIEILCIDGGSTDASPDILHRFQQKDKRIKIINDSNTSYGHKINIGVAHAQGKYIAILETDDMMAPDMLKKLYDIAEQKELDYADADFYSFFTEEDGYVYVLTKKYTDSEAYGRYFQEKDEYSLKLGSMAIWTGIYRKSFLDNNKIRLNESEGASFQDGAFRFLVSCMGQRTYHLNEPLYCYRIDNAGSSVKDQKKIMAIAEEYRYLEDCLIQNGIDSPGIWEAYYKWKYAGYYYNLKRLDIGLRPIFEECYMREVQKDLNGKKISRESFSEGDSVRMFGLIDNREYFYDCLNKQKREEEYFIFHLKEIVEKTRGRITVIFGCGKCGRKVLRLIEGRSTHICLCDNDFRKQGTVYCGYQVYSCDEAAECYPDAVYVVANKTNGQEMKEQLIEKGIPDYNIILY